MVGTSPTDKGLYLTLPDFFFFLQGEYIHVLTI